MIRVLLLTACFAIALTIINLAFPEKRSIVLRADIQDYQNPPSELVQALEDGWTVNGGDNRRVYTLERPRLRLP